MQQKLIRHLSHELWQAEVSASQHCRRAARRLGDTPPARVLLKAAEHADDALGGLINLDVGQPVVRTVLRAALSKLFFETRDTLADKWLSSERSYRGTLLALRHSMDLVRLLREATDSAGLAEHTQFFDHWWTRRQPLVEAVADQLRWFAHRPQRALHRPKTSPSRSSGQDGVFSQ